MLQGLTKEIFVSRYFVLSVTLYFAHEGEVTGLVFSFGATTSLDARLCSRKNPPIINSNLR